MSFAERYFLLCAEYADVILLHFFGHHSKEMLRSYRIPLSQNSTSRSVEGSPSLSSTPSLSSSPSLSSRTESEDGRDVRYANVSFFVTGGMAPRHNYRPFYAHITLKRADALIQNERTRSRKKPSAVTLCAPHFQAASLKTFSLSLSDAAAPLSPSSLSLSSFLLPPLSNFTLPEWIKWYEFADAYDVSDFCLRSIAEAVWKMEGSGRFLQVYMDLQANLPESTSYSEMACGLSLWRKGEYGECVERLCGKKKGC